MTKSQKKLETRIPKFETIQLTKRHRILNKLVQISDFELLISDFDSVVF